MNYERAQLGGLDVTEVAEQIYRFALFTPVTCRSLIAAAERCGRWRTASDGHFEANPYTDTQEYWEPDTVLPLAQLGLQSWWDEIVRRDLQPLIERLWRTFSLKQITPPYLLKYTPSSIAAMALHHDLETVTLVGYLNDDFEGGGTSFPRWRYSTRGVPPGTAILYPGGLSHEHAALPITAGTRYVFCASFF